MGKIVVLLAILLGVSWSSAEEPVPFNPKKPLKAEAGKTYRLEIAPGKGAKKVVLLLTSTTEEFDGKPWTTIDAITEVGSQKHALEHDEQTFRLEIADYDGDGYKDFRFPTSSGTGGTWYGYFRFDGQHYAPWPEPGDLGINEIDLKTNTAIASSRSGPAYLLKRYKIVGGKFILSGRDIFDRAEALRDQVPKEFADTDYVLIEEKIEDGKVVSRKASKPKDDQ